MLHIPTFAGRFDRKTLTHSTMAAPELSMQLTSVWNGLHKWLFPHPDLAYTYL